MKKKIAIGISFILVVCLLLFGISGRQKIYAKSAQLSLNVLDTVKKEDVFTVQLKLESEVPLYSIDACIHYDENLVEFIPGDERINGSAGILQVKDSFPEETKSAIYEISFRAIEIGDTQMSLSDVYLIDYADMEYIEVISSSTSFSVKVNRTEETDARLERLEVAPGELEAAFEPDVFDYEMHVEEDVEMVGVSAKPIDENAMVESDIPEMLKMGENRVTITVTSASGTVQTYTIVIYKEKSNPSPQEEVEEGSVLETES